MVLPSQRSAVLNRARSEKMARSAHAYVRGNTIKFYEWLDSSGGKIPDGPSVWICGDCHLGNLGPLADMKGRVAVQIRDLDQTVIGNPAHDLIRLGLSVASAVRSSDLPGVTTARVVEQIAAGYQKALLPTDDKYGDAKKAGDKSHKPKLIQNLLAASVRRRWHHLAQERIEDVTPTIPLGKRFWTLRRDERAALKALVSTKPVKKLITSLQKRPDDSAIALVDSAYWMKGCSSLGRLRYALLLRVGDDPGELCLVDVKEGVTAAAPRDPKADMPRDNAVRVVTGAQALSPNLGDRMIAARLFDKAVVLRELLPQDLKIEINRLSITEAIELASYLAGVVGRAHARQMEPETRASWAAQLSRHSKTLDAPSWLWTSVVELLALHEAAYLDHCRRYLSEAA